MVYWSHPGESIRSLPSNFALRLAIEIRVKDAHLGDAIYGQIVPPGRAPNGFRRRRVIGAEGLFPVIAHIRADPGDAVFLVAKHDSAADFCAFVVQRDL